MLFSRLLGRLLITSALLTAISCTQLSSNTTNNNAAGSPVAANPVLVVADGDWPGYNRTLDSQRYSPLNQITSENVGSLKRVCMADLGESGNFQSGIVVVNNTLYATTDTNTYAYNPATCQQKWKYHYEKPTPDGLKVNRGVAYADGKVFRGMNTGFLLAIDATQRSSFHYEIGQRLSALRDEGVLVIGSGDIVHNLHTYAWGKHGAEPFDWAMRFDAKARELILNDDHEPLGADAGPLSAATVCARAQASRR